jgi:hypothetical protein
MSFGGDFLDSPIAGMSFPDGGQCVNCRYYRDGQKCAAFPNGIPEAIHDDVVDHTVPVDGDNGIQYEPWPSFAVPGETTSQEE